MAADALLFAVCAWLATYMLHSTLLIVGAWVGGGLLARVRGCQDSLVLVRERLWKLALFGGVLTASLATFFERESWSSRWFLSAARHDAVSEHSREQAISPSLAIAHDSGPRAEIERSVPELRAHRAAPRPMPQPDRTARPIAPSEPPVAVDERALQAPAAATLVSAPAHADVSVTSAQPPSATIAPTWVRALVALWLAGVLLGAGVWALEWAHLFRCLRGRKTLTHGALHTLFERLRRRSGVSDSVRVSITPRIAGPITLGIKHAEICLPSRVERDLRSDEIEAMLAHELAHAVRRDPAWLAACRAIEILFFFQPLNRLARRRLQDQAEFLCDDWAVVRLGTRVALASCLTEIATWIVNERRALPAPSMVVRGSRLTHRVERLLDDAHRPERTREQRAMWIGSGLAFAAVVLCAPTVAARVDHERQPAAPASASAPQPVLTPAALLRETDAAAPSNTESSAADSTPPVVALLSTPELTFEAILLDSEIDAIEAEFAELERAASRRGAPEELRQAIARIASRLEGLRAARAELEREIDLAVQEALTSQTPDSRDMGEPGPPDSVPSPTTPSSTHDNETKEMP